MVKTGNNSETTQRMDRRMMTRLRTAFTRNLPLKATSFILAFALWFVITGGPQFQASITIRLDLDNYLPEGWALADDYIRDINLTLTGRQDIIQRISNSEQAQSEIYFMPRSDSIKSTAGPQPVSISGSDFTISSRMPNVRVKTVSPNIIYVNLDNNTSKQVPISLDISGDLPSGFRLFDDQPVVRPAEVTVSGAKSLVDHLESFILPMELSNIIISSSEKTQIVKTLDMHPLLTYTNHQVEVELDIVEINENKRITVTRVEFTGYDEETEAIASFSPKQFTWQISGPHSWLEELVAENVYLQIDVSSLERNSSQEVEIIEAFLKFDNEPQRRELVMPSLQGRNNRITLRISR